MTKRVSSIALSKPDVTAILVLLVILAMLVWDRLGHTYHIAQTDLMSYFLPAFSFLGERLRSGDIPGWNPHQFSGAPFAGNPESGWMYLPAMFIFAFFTPLTALYGFVFFHVALSGVGTYALGRVYCFHPIAAMAAGIAFASGPVLSHTSCCTVFAEVEAWFPVTILGVELAVRGGLRLRAGGWALASLGISQILGAWLGQGAYYGILLVGSYLILRTLVLSAPDRDSLMARARAFAIHSSVIFGLGGGLAAAGLLPRLDALGRSTLAGGGYTGTGSVPPEVVGYEPLVLAARILSDSAGGRYYIGAAGLVLAVAAPFIARRRAIATYYTLATVVTIILVLQPTPLHTLFYVLPGFELLQSHVPNRILVLSFFTVAVAAGAAIDALLSMKWRSGLVSLIPAVTATVSIWLLLPRMREWLDISDAPLQAAIIAVLALFASCVMSLPLFSRWNGVMFVGRHAVSVIVLVVMLWDPAGRGWTGVPPEDNLPRKNLIDRHTSRLPLDNGAAEFLTTSQTMTPSRFFGFDPVLQTFGRRGCCDYHKEVMRLEGEMLLVGNRSMTLGLYDVQGYDPVQSSHYFSYFHVLNDRAQDYHEAAVTPEGLDSPLLDLINARYIVLSTEPVPPEHQELMKSIDGWPTVYENDKLRVLENPEALPRAWIVHNARRVTSERALTMIADGEVNPRTHALVEVAAPKLQRTDDPTADEVQILIHEPEEVRLATRTDADGLLVLSEVYDPGWRACVDGKEVMIYQTNYLLRGIPVPAGEHTVEFRYEPTSLRLGLVVTSIAIVGWLGLISIVADSWPFLLTSWKGLRRRVNRTEVKS